MLEIYIKLKLYALLFVITENTKYSAQDLTITYNNWFHIIIFRLKTNMIFFLVKSFYSCRIINQSYYSVSILSSITLLNKNLIAIKNTIGTMDKSVSPISIFHILIKVNPAIKVASKNIKKPQPTHS